MNKPHHSLAGFRRYVQMSATRVFILVEGRQIDAYFYSELGRPVCEAAGLSYDIVRADRVGEAGGKQVLIQAYRYLESAGSLIERAKGNISWCIFYLDKDIDDVLRTVIVSPHIVYTPFYSVENALFMHGEVVRAAAAASSLDAGRIGFRIPDSGAWRRQKAEHWKQFVVLCIFSQKSGVNCDCHYGCNTSPLNNPADAPANVAEAAARRAELHARLGLRPDDFDRKFGASARLVERIYRKGQHDLVFNGKWYRELLIREIELAAEGEHFRRHALSNSITSALAATLDFNAAWTEHFRSPLRRLIEARG